MKSWRGQPKWSAQRCENSEEGANSLLLNLLLLLLQLQSGLGLVKLIFFKIFGHAAVTRDYENMLPKGTM